MFVKMKIKYFSKRKLNVRISKTKINVQFWDFPKIAAFWKNPEKFWSNLAKNQENSDKFCNICKKSAKKSAIFNEKIEIRKRCKGVHCVDLGESFPTSIYVQNLASIQPRTSLFNCFNFSPALVI